jgi:outer membrane protein assembly factor BamB
MCKYHYDAATRLIAVLVASALTGCAVFHGPAAPLTDGPAAGAGWTGLFPAPGDLRAASAAEVCRLGRDYEQGWPHDNVIRAANSASFTPSFAGDQCTFEHLAYALYAFDVTEFTGEAVLHAYFDVAGDAGCCWVGLADYARKRWDWARLPTVEDLHSALPITLAGRQAGGVMPLAIVFTGMQPWQLNQLKLGSGAEALPGDWPVAGHDRSHTHHSTLVASQTGKLEWRFGTYGAGSPLTGVATGANGLIYAAAGDSLYAFEATGRQVWACGGVAPSTAPVVAPDGTVYVGGSLLHPGLHAVSSSGALLWSYSTGTDAAAYVHKDPAIAPDGTVYFANDSGFLGAINPDGTQRWSRQMPNVSCSPAVDSTGAVCIGYTTGGWDVIGHLLVVNADGSNKWTTTLSPVHSRPGIGPADEVYCNAQSRSGVNLLCFGADGSVQWSRGDYNLSASSEIAVAPDGTLYAGGKTGLLYAIEPDGDMKWSVDTGYELSAGPALGPTGKICVGSSAGGLHAFNAQGVELWSVPSAGIVSRPAGDAYGAFYACGEDALLYGVSAGGVLVWKAGAGGAIRGCPVAAADGTVYCGSADGYLYALMPDGTQKWRFHTGGGIAGSPALGPDGTVYAGSADYKLYAVSPDGILRWTFDTTGVVESSPCVGPDGTIYFGSDDTYFYAVNPDGTPAWSFKTVYLVTGSPAVGDDGEVYVSSWDRRVYALSPDGTEDWNYRTAGRVKSSPVLGPDGKVYAACEISSEAGMIYALLSDGRVAWSYATEGGVISSLALREDGTVFAASELTASGGGGILYSINRDGFLRWKLAGVPCNNEGPALGADETLYIGTLDGRVLALTDTGHTAAVLWSCDAMGGALGAPAIAGGKLYIGGSAGCLFAFGD